MIKNVFKVAWRNLIKNLGYSVINIVGLATGMAVTLLIGLWVYDELVFDQYHKNHSQVGQVLATQTFNGETGTNESIVVPLGEAFRTEYASVFKKVALSTPIKPHILSVERKNISNTGMWAEADLPALLSLDLRGDINALNDASSILLSESVAKALFGDADPNGKIIRVDNKADMKVAGIYSDLPVNTTLNEAGFMLSWSNPANKANKQTDQWENHGNQLFVELNDNVDFKTATVKIKDLMSAHIKDWKEELLIHPMDKWHLYNEFKDGKIHGGRIQLVWLLGIIGFFVLLLACINFMNLSTARSEKRAKEIGIRKAIGSLRKHLVGQFLGEAVLIAFVALVFSLILVYLFLPAFNTLAGKSIDVPLTSPWFWVSLIGFTLFTALLAGSYPAFYLSGFSPTRVLKGTFRFNKYALIPRKALVVVQFTISIALIIGTIVVFQQVQFTKDRAVGYSRDRLVIVDMNTPDLYKDYNGLRGELLQTGEIEDMAESNSATTEIWSNNTGIEWKGKDPGSNPLFGTIAVTHDFGKTVGWKILAGRDFSRDFPADSGAFILNESAVNLTGLQDPVGKTMRWNGEDHVVTGVVKDMVMESPYEGAVPTIFHLQYGWVNKIIVRIKPTVPISNAIASVKKVFNKLNPASPFEYKFVDEEFGKKFQVEERIGKLAGFFSALAILISCLGLFGLSFFVAEQRAKEISIRKVLGASGMTLWRLLTRDFVWLVVISLFITIPLSYYYMKQWIEGYEYRASLSWWIFALPGAGAIVVALITVSFQAIKASVLNPIKNLRSE